MNGELAVAYGYLHVSPGVDDETVWEIEVELKRYAQEHGFQLAGSFHEYISGCFATWDALTKELRRANAHHVIVPSFTHLTQHELLLAYLLERLERRARSKVHELHAR
jgi:hypothetical protein